FEKYLPQLRIFVDEPQNGPVRPEIFVNLRRDCLIGQVVQILYQYERIAFSHCPEGIRPWNFSEIGDDFPILEPGNEFFGEAVRRAVEVESHFFDQLGVLIEHDLKPFEKCPGVARTSEGPEMSKTAKICFPIDGLRLVGRASARIDYVGLGGIGCGSSDRPFSCALCEKND